MTDAQKLAEFICVRIAKKNKINITDGFWKEDYWAKEYKKTIIAAHSILKVYSLKVILAALNRPEAYWIHSLRASKLHDLCRMEQHRQNQLNGRITQSEAPTIANPETLPPIRKTNNMMDKLK